MFTHKINKGLIVEVDEYVVRIKEGKRVIKEFKCKTHTQAARIGNQLNELYKAGIFGRSLFRNVLDISCVIIEKCIFYFRKGKKY